MSPKKVPSANANPKKKKLRTTIEFKKGLIAKYESGMRVADLARMYGKSTSTISSILAKKKEIKEANVAKGVNVLSKRRSQTMEDVEKLLLVWLNEKQLAGDNVSDAIICEKARQLHADLVKEMPKTIVDTAAGEFKASRGWLEKFKKRSGIRQQKSSIKAAPSNQGSSHQGSSHQGSSNQSYPGKLGTTRRTRNSSATSTVSPVVNSLSQHDSLSQPSAAKFQRKTGRRFENQCFEKREQKPVFHSVQPSLPSHTQMRMQQPLPTAAPPPIPTQPAPRQVQMLPPPVQVAVAKPKPVEKPRPREKQVFVVSDHQRCVMSNLASLWKRGKFCDAGIGNGLATVMVHKLVLSAVCPKLLSVFDMDVLSNEFLQVNFPVEVSTDALNAFAEYMYKGILDLDCDILEQLKIIARRLDMKEFEQLCDSHLPNHMHQPTLAAAASFSVPLIQTTMPITPMTSFGSAASTSMQSDPSISTRVINIKQEIPESELTQVKKDTAAMYGQELVVSSLAPNKSGNTGSSVIRPRIKTEPIGPEDEKYGRLSSSSSNQALTLTTSSSSSSSVAPASSTSIASSTEFSIPFLETKDVKSTKLKAIHSYDVPVVSDLSPVSCIVQTMCCQSSSANKDTFKPLNQPSDTLTSVVPPKTISTNGAVYPVRLFTARGDNLPLLTTHISEAMTVNQFISSEKNLIS